jgi:hypothetical protein
MARDPKHRTSARALRKLAEGHMFFEFGSLPTGRWDSFSTRTSGLRIQSKMAADFSGDAGKMRRVTTSKLAKTLGVNLDTGIARDRRAFSNFAVALSLVPEVARWTPAEKRALVAVIRAKAGPDETQYLRLLQTHDSLRAAFLRIGSTNYL